MGSRGQTQSQPRSVHLIDI